MQSFITQDTRHMYRSHHQTMFHSKSSIQSWLHFVLKVCWGQLDWASSPLHIRLKRTQTWAALTKIVRTLDSWKLKRNRTLPPNHPGKIDTFPQWSKAKMSASILKQDPKTWSMMLPSPRTLQKQISGLALHLVPPPPPPPTPSLTVCFATFCSLIKEGDYPEHSHVAFYPNKQHSFEQSPNAQRWANSAYTGRTVATSRWPELLEND